MSEPGVDREVPDAAVSAAPRALVVGPVSAAEVPDAAVSSDTSPARLIGPVRSMLAREEVRYLVVAGSTTLCYLAILAVLLTTDLHYMVAIAIAQVTVISAAFPTYRRLVFRSNGRWQSDLPRFVGVWSGGFVAGIVATPALVELAGLPPLLAQVLAVAVVAILSFLGHKYLSFRR